MSEQVVCGVDIGGTKTAVVLSSTPPAVIKRLAFPTNPAGGPEHALARIKECIYEALSSQQLQVSDLSAIGVSCGSPLDPTNGIIQQPPNLPTWKEVPITSILEGEFRAKCFLENDANAGALAERRFGAAQGTQNMIYLTMGTGIGAGLVLNGQLYRGASQLAGEIGHVRLTRFGPIGHNKSGTVEGWASGAGMARAARSAIDEAGASGKQTLLHVLDGRNGHGISAHEIWDAAQSGDDLAKRIISTTGERLGDAIAILIDLLNPECIVVGGLALRMGEVLLGPARAVVMQEALALSASVCRIVPAALGEQVGDVAAVCVALEGLQRGR
ncbi:MAG: ROK family protein [Terracidiphilus sp.]|jgi:glucokinase